MALEERTAEPLLQWLKTHPSVPILVHDQAAAYTLAGRLANQAIVLVADRFPLGRNVSEALKQLVPLRGWPWPPLDSSTAFRYLLDSCDLPCQGRHAALGPR